MKGIEQNYQERKRETGKEWYDYVREIDYKGYKVNVAEYGEYQEQICKKRRRMPRRKTVSCG